MFNKMNVPVLNWYVIVSLLVYHLSILGLKCFLYPPRPSLRKELRSFLVGYWPLIEE